VDPPPAYIQTHKTTEPPPAYVQTSTSQSATTTSSKPPQNVPQEIPANEGEVTKDFAVTAIAVTETKIDTTTNAPTAKVIEFQGHATPDTYITLYIYSTPIIVTVKTDAQGNWKYSLNQELEDGDHHIYVAQIDNSGTVVAKSDPILFTKAAASAQLVSSDAVPIQPQKVNFFQEYFMIIALVILAIAIIIGLTVIGLMGRKGQEVTPEESDISENTQ
jgi:hypothetical protein